MNVGSIPKFQVETRRVLVLTATARGDTVLLIVSMNKSHQQDHRQNVSLEEEEGEVQAGTLESSDELRGEEQGQPQQILQAEENYIQGGASGNLVEDNVNIIEEAMENIAINDVNMDTENESFSLRISPPNTTESEEADTENDVMNFEEDCSYDGTEEDDDEYTYTYEEVTDSDTEDVDES